MKDTRFERLRVVTALRIDASKVNTQTLGLRWKDAGAVARATVEMNRPRLIERQDREMEQFHADITAYAAQYADELLAR